MQTDCPQCSQKLVVEDDKVPAGPFMLRCPKCQKAIKLPGKGGAALSPARCGTARRSCSAHSIGRSGDSFLTAVYGRERAATAEAVRSGSSAGTPRGCGCTSLRFRATDRRRRRICQKGLACSHRPVRARATECSDCLAPAMRLRS